MEYGFFVISVIVGILILVIGIVLAKRPNKRTEAVIARIIFAKEIKRHPRGKSIYIPLPIYLYKLKYSYQGQDHVISLRTEEYLGKHRDEIMIEIDPRFPDQYYTPGTKSASSVLLIFLGIVIVLVSIVIAATMMAQ